MVSPSFAAKAIETMFGTNYATSSLTSSIVLENPFNSLHRVDLNAMFKKYDTHNTGYLELLDCVHVTQEFLKVFARGALTQCVRVTKSRTLDHYHDATFSEAMKLASRDTVVFINKTVVRVPSAVVMELRDVLDEDGKGKISKAEFMERSSVLKTDRVRLPLLLAIAESFAFRVSHYWGHRFDHHQQEIKTQKEQKAPLKSASNDNKSKSSGASSYRNRPVYTGSSDSIIDIKCLMKAYQRLQLSDLGGSGGLVSSSSSLRSSRNHHRSNSRSSAGDQDEHLITSKRLKKLLIDDCGISPSTALDYVDQFSQYYDFQHTGRISIEAFIREYKRMSLFQCITAIKRQARQRGKDKNTSAHSRSTYSGNSTNQHYNNKDMGNTGVEGVSITWKELEQHLLRVMTPESAIKQLTALGYRHYNYTHNHNHNHKHTHNTASSTSRHRHSSGSSSSNNSSGINDEHKHEGGKNENENKQNNDNGGDNDYGTADGGSLPLSYVEGTGSITLAELEAWYTQHSEDVLLGYKGEYGDIQPGEEGGTATLCLGSAGCGIGYEYLHGLQQEHGVNRDGTLDRITWCDPRMARAGLGENFSASSPHSSTPSPLSSLSLASSGYPFSAPSHGSRGPHFASASPVSFAQSAAPMKVWSPRFLFIGDDDETDNVVQNYYRPQQVVLEKGDCGGLFHTGYSGDDAHDAVDETMERVRAIQERSESSNTFHLILGTAGGTGGGVGSQIIARLKDQYPLSNVVCTAVLPSMRNGDHDINGHGRKQNAINTVFACNQLIESSDLVIGYENRTVEAVDRTHRETREKLRQQELERGEAPPPPPSSSSSLAEMVRLKTASPSPCATANAAIARNMLTWTTPLRSKSHSFAPCAFSSSSLSFASSSSSSPFSRGVGGAGAQAELDWNRLIQSNVPFPRMKFCSTRFSDASSGSCEQQAACIVKEGFSSLPIESSQAKVFYSTTVFRSRSLSSLNAASAVSKMRRKYERNFSSWTPASSSYLLSPYESPSQHSTGELSSAILTNDTSFSSYLKDFVAVCSNELNNTDFAKYEAVGADRMELTEAQANCQDLYFEYHKQ